MKNEVKYEVAWRRADMSDSKTLLRHYDQNGEVSNLRNWNAFETSDLSIAQKVFAAELAYADSTTKDGVPMLPKLASFDWGNTLTESDSAWKNVVILEITKYEFDEDGMIANIETLDSSDYYFNE